MYRMSTAQGGGGDFAKPDGADLALLLQGGQGSDDIFQLLGLVQTMDVIEIDMIDAKPAQRGLTGAADVSRAVIDAAIIGASLTHNAEFGRKLDLAAIDGFQKAAEQFFIMAEPIGIRGIEEGNALIERRLQRHQ